MNTSSCVLDVTSDEGVVSLQYELDSSSHWVTTNATVAEVRVSGDGVHTVQVKVCTASVHSMHCLTLACVRSLLRVWTRREMCLLARAET